MLWEMVRSSFFQRLGADVVPEALRATSGNEHTSVTARLRLASLAASQLRSGEELLERERRGRHAGKAAIRFVERGQVVFVEALGDLVRATDVDDVLAVLDPVPDSKRGRGLEAAGRLERQLRGEDATRRRLLHAYGYDDARFTGRRLPLRGHVRLALCLAADATFTPYAAGHREAAILRPATLRTDLDAASRTIWAWARTHRALARALYAARLDAERVAVAFPAFTAAFDRMLRHQLETSIPHPDLDSRIRSVSRELGRIATEGIVRSGEIGRSGDGNITQQVLRHLVANEPSWIPDEVASDAEEEFAKGAAQLLSEALAGLRPLDETASILERIASELRDIRKQRDESD